MMKKFQLFSKLCLENLEERTLLAVTAGGVEASAALAAPTEGEIWIVNTLFDSIEWDSYDDIVSLREAIGCASIGDTIIFDDGLFGGTIALSGRQLEIYYGIRIDASSIGGITIDAGGKSRVFEITGGGETNPVELIGLTIIGGNVDNDGGGIYCHDGILTMMNCTVSENISVWHGGGIFNDHGALTLTDSTISGNTALDGGGILNESGTLTLIGSTVSGNTAYGSDGSYGGGIYNELGTVTMTDSTVSENTASSGGGIYNYYSTLTFTNSTVSGNTANYSGGGIYNVVNSTLTITDSTVSNNTANNSGGGIYNYNGSTLEIAGSIISENIATNSDGGGIYNNSTLLTIAGSTISANTANNYGGGIYSVNSSMLTITDTSVSGNTSIRHAGGVYNGGTATFTDCIISNNSAHEQEWGDGMGMQYYGGGICNKGKMTLIRSVVSGNIVYGFGGGIYSNTESSLLLVCSAVFGNSANRGGGVYNEDGSLTFSNCTVSGNRGGGIHNWTGALTLTNTISSLNDSASNSDINDSFNGSNNIIGFDPGFVTPPVFESGELVNFNAIDLSLSSTSWAIDRGNNDVVEIETDLVGNSRIYAAWLDNPVVDIGAYEYQELVEKDIEEPGLTVTTPLDIVNDTDRLISLREAIIYAEPGDTIKFDTMLTGETIQIVSARLLIDKPICIDASEVGEITIDAENKTRILEIESCDDSVELIKLSIERGEIYNLGILRFKDCVISGNKGHAIHNTSDASVSLVNCTVSDNSAAYSGGGVFNDGGTVVLDSCAFLRNSATEGAAIWNENGVVTAVNSLLSGNSASLGGGFYNGKNGTAMLTGCTISTNSSSSLTFGGGGIYILGGGTMTLTNCLVSGNSARSGGGIYNRGGLVMNGCTVAGNSARQYGGGIYNDAAKITLYNTIVASNAAKTDTDMRNATLAGVVKAYNSLSSFLGWKENVNCLVYDSSLPLFVDATVGDYTLAENSQAIDKGNNSYVTTGTDLAGNSRIANGIVDIGAYEYQFGGSAEQLATPTITTGNQGVYVSYGANRHQIAWNAVENASGYELQYSADGSRWTAVSVSGTSAIVTGLPYGEDVQYRVRALGTGSYTDSGWSEIKVFNVCPMDVSGDGDIGGVDRNILAVSWGAEEGEDEYRYYADINADGSVGGLDRNYLGPNWGAETGDDGLLYPRPVAAADAVFAEYESGDLGIDLSIF